jgi:hypothetical protein
MLMSGYSHPQSTYIYRVPQCISPRRNWDSPNPSPASECASKVGEGVVEGAHLPAGEGDPNSDD